MTTNIDIHLPWSKCSFIVLDLEGTGAQHKEKEGIVEVAAIEVSNKVITSNYYYSLVNPEIEVPPMISRIHGLKNKELENEPTISEIRSQLFSFINNKILVGHNVSVDYRVLKLKMPDYTPSMVLDTKKISSHFWNHDPKHGLDELISRFNLNIEVDNLPIKRKRHSAFYDAYATSLLFIKMLEEKMHDATSLKELAQIASITILNENKNSQSTLF